MAARPIVHKLQDVGEEALVLTLYLGRRPVLAAHEIVGSFVGRNPVQGRPGVGRRRIRRHVGVEVGARHIARGGFVRTVGDDDVRPAPAHVAFDEDVLVVLEASDGD